MEKRRIIDFHMHPYFDMSENIAIAYAPTESVLELGPDMERAGFDMFAGSVAKRIPGDNWSDVKLLNDHALKLRDMFPGKYIPGIHIHPGFVRESCEELERAHSLNVRLIGELVPYMMGWQGYTSPECIEIFTLAQELGMVVSAHPSNPEDMDKLAELFPKMTIVYAHPGDFDACKRNAERLAKYDYVYLDLCGTGLFRYGMLRYLIDHSSKEKLLFGTDYPICNPLMQVAGVEYEKLTEDEKDAVFYLNAKRVLGL